MQDHDITTDGPFIKNCGDLAYTDIIIPRVLNGYLVGRISHGTFSSKGLTSLRLPSTLREIDFSAFQANQLKTM